MLPYIAIIASVLILAVALRIFAEPDDPGNGTVHHSGDEDEPPDSSEDDVLLAA